jgi:hypothetical protein
VGGNYALVWADKYLARTPNMKLTVLQNIYEVVCDSILLFVLAVLFVLVLVGVFILMRKEESLMFPEFIKDVVWI